ncbi:MAG TPA: GNAT family N-acetyltransferase [Streptomyces sp.]|nr:GNAT family N-acetyltransferase [Streptomyces sp.]
MPAPPWGGPDRRPVRSRAAQRTGRPSPRLRRFRNPCRFSRSGGTGEAVRSRADDGSVELAAARILAGLACVAAAVEGRKALCAGQHQPVGTVSEIAGVGTLPTARRRGLALAVTAALTADARSRGVETVFFSAGDDDVARIYARLGFRRVATALIAEPVEWRRVGGPCRVALSGSATPPPAHAEPSPRVPEFPSKLNAPVIPGCWGRQGRPLGCP